MVVVSVTVAVMTTCSSEGCLFHEVGVSRGRVMIENFAHSCIAPRGQANGTAYHLWSLPEFEGIAVELDRQLPDVRIARAANGELFIDGDDHPRLDREFVTHHLAPFPELQTPDPRVASL